MATTVTGTGIGVDGEQGMAITPQPARASPAPSLIGVGDLVPHVILPTRQPLWELWFRGLTRIVVFVILLISRNKPLVKGDIGH